MDRLTLLALRDELQDELKRRRVKGVEGVSIGGRDGRHILIVLMNGVHNDSDVPVDFRGVNVEVEDVGEIERY